MSTTAADIMQSHVISVSPETPLIDVQRLFASEEIGAAPVVEDDGRVVGMISSIDLVRATAEEHDAGSSVPVYFHELLEFSGPDWASSTEDLQDRLSSAVVADFMTPDVCTVEPHATVSEIARTMRENRIHRVLVVKEGSLAGIVSTFDLLSVLEKGA